MCNCLGLDQREVHITLIQSLGKSRGISPECRKWKLSTRRVNWRPTNIFVSQSKSIDDCPASSESDTTCALGVSCAGKRRSLHSVSENHSEVHRTYHNLLNFLICVFTIAIPETAVCELYFAKLS